MWESVRGECGVCWGVGGGEERWEKVRGVGEGEEEM